MQKNTSKHIAYTVLGSGTSSGVPTIGCDCPTCTSTDSRDKRLRASLLIQTENTNLVIDTTPDFRQQMLTNNINRLDGILYTHPHFDHIGGFDDIRGLNFVMRRSVNIYANQFTLDRIKQSFYYAFETPEQLGGGVPMCDIHIIDDAPFRVNELEIIPIFLKHGILPVIGYRIGNLAYCTDVNFIPESENHKLENLDVLIIGGLRYTPHPTHFSIDEAIEESNLFKLKQTYITHLAHQVKHSTAILPDNIQLAYDGLKIELE